MYVILYSVEPFLFLSEIVAQSCFAVCVKHKRNEREQNEADITGRLTHRFPGNHRRYINNIWDRNSTKCYCVIWFFIEALPLLPWKLTLPLWLCLIIYAAASDAGYSPPEGELRPYSSRESIAVGSRKHLAHRMTTTYSTRCGPLALVLPFGWVPVFPNTC